MTERFDVCVVGSANLDLVARSPRIPSPGETLLGSAYTEHAGGKGLNQAVAASRSGALTCFVGAVGDDAAGDRLRAVLSDDSIDHSNVAIAVGEPTGRAVIIVDTAGENSIVVIPGANATVAARNTTPEAIVTLAQLEVPLDTVTASLRAAKSAGSTTVLNPAPARQLPVELVAACDVIIPNEHELALVGGTDHLLATGCGAVVVTRGPAGVDIIDAAGHRSLPAFSVDPVDTTGAGDAFCGALSARLAAGDDLDRASRWATAAGALATTIEGAVPAQPHAAAIRHLLAR